jgi:hypothetical protein
MTYNLPGEIVGTIPPPSDIPSVYDGPPLPESDPENFSGEPIIRDNDGNDGSGGANGAPEGESGGPNTPGFGGNPENDGESGTGTATDAEYALYLALARGLFPSMPDSFILAFADQYVQFADLPNGTTLALGQLRQDSRYAIWFPGNMRDDGTVHISEGQYWDQRALHEQAVRQAGLDPQIFSEEQYISLISGDVSVSEFGNRVRTQSNEILARSEEFQSYYAELYGFVPSDTAILQSVFTGNNDALIQQAGQATVGFEGELRGFDVSLQLAASLYDNNIQNQGQAQELFGQAASDVPLFGALAQRHFDQDDDFDLGEFLQAAVFDDQQQLSRMQRLVGQERSLFSRSTTLRERNGQVVGLTAE